MGSTSLWLQHRILKHKDMFISGLPMSKPSFSVMREHSNLHKQPFKSTDFKILASHPERFDLIKPESIQHEHGTRAYHVNTHPIVK